MDNFYGNEKKAKKPCGKYTLLFVIAAVIYLTINVYLSARLVNIWGMEDSGKRVAELLVYILVELSIMGISLNLLSTVFALIGLILTATRREKGQKTLQLILFAVMTALPVITQVTLYIICG